MNKTITRAKRGERGAAVQGGRGRRGAELLREGWVEGRGGPPKYI